MVVFYITSEWLIDRLDGQTVKFCQTHILGVAECCSCPINILCDTSKKHFDKVKLIKFKG